MPTDVPMQVMNTEKSRVIAGMRQYFQFRGLIKEDLSMEITDRKRDGLPKIAVGWIPHQPRPRIATKTNNHDSPLQ
jgi:hypothetical protein